MLSTVLVGAAVAAVIAGAAWVVYGDMKKGACPGGCAGCKACGCCNREVIEIEDR